MTQSLAHVRDAAVHAELVKEASNTKIKVLSLQRRAFTLKQNVDATINLPLPSRVVPPVVTTIAVEQELCKLMLSRSVLDRRILQVTQKLTGQVVLTLCVGSPSLDTHPAFQRRHLHSKAEEVADPCSRR